MNKDTPVLSFVGKHEESDELNGCFEDKEAYGKLPFRFKDMEHWVIARKGSSYTANLPRSLI